MDEDGVVVWEDEEEVDEEFEDGSEIYEDEDGPPIKRRKLPDGETKVCNSISLSALILDSRQYREKSAAISVGSLFSHLLWIYFRSSFFVCLCMLSYVAAGMMYALASQLNASNNRLLWLALLGIRRNDCLPLICRAD